MKLEIWMDDRKKPINDSIKEHFSNLFTSRNMCVWLENHPLLVTMDKIKEPLHLMSPDKAPTLDAFTHFFY